MIKIAEKDKDYVYVYSKISSEIDELKEKMEVALETTYNDCKAIVVKKQKNTMS